MALASLVIICLTQGWMMGLEFQLDDFEQVAQAADSSEGAVLLGQDTEEQAETRNRPTFVKFFRPLLHLSFMVDYRLFGASPRAFHTVNLALHWLVVVTFFVVLTKLGFQRRIASLASLLFAIHPGKWGAVSWVAARGDLLMALFFLWSIWALHRHRTGGGRLTMLLPAGFLLCALLSKEGAVVCPILLVGLDLIILRRLGTSLTLKQTLLRGAPLLLMVPAYLALRYFLFGPWANYYAGEMRTFSLDVVLAIFTDFIPITRQLLIGYFYYGEAGGSAWFLPAHDWIINLVFLFTLSGGVVWIIRHPMDRIRGALLGIGFLFIASAPTLRFFEAASGFDATRLFYLPSCLLCLLIALPLAGVFSRLRPLRAAARLLLFILLAMWGLAGVNQYRAQAHAADVISRIRSDLLAFRSADADPTIAYLIVEAPPGIDHVPLYGTFMTYAFQATFEDEPLLARSIHNMDFFLGQRHMYQEDHPARLLRWDTEKERLLADGPVIPGPTGYQPILELAPEQTEVPIPKGLRPRDCRTLKFLHRTPPESPFWLDICFFTDESNSEPSLRVPLYWDPSRGTAEQIFISLDTLEPWIRMGIIRHLRLELREGTRPDIRAIVTGETLPTITLSNPKDGERIPVDEAEPIFAFEGSPALTYYRLYVHHEGYPLSWTLPAKQLLQLGDGKLGFKFSMAGVLSNAPDPAHPARLERPRYWADMTAGAFRTNVLDAKGVEGFDIDWWIEGFTGQPFLGPWRFHHAQARSPHFHCRVIAPQ